jgi:hypothetical protein
MDAWRAVLGPPDVYSSLIQFNLMPFQAAKLACSQSMTIGHEYHGGIAMAVAAALPGAVHQRLNLTLGEILANCIVYSGWRAQLGRLIRHDNPSLIPVDWKYNSLFVHSYQ